MVCLKKRFVAGMATLVMTATMATGIAQNTSFDGLFNNSNVIVAEAASLPKVYYKTDVTSKETYMSNGTRKHQNNLNKKDSNIILIGDSRTCQLLSLDAKSGKHYFSGLGAWGQTYQRNSANGITDATTKNLVNNKYSADSYIKAQIKQALNSDKPAYIWVFGSINETYDTDASSFINYVKEIRDYCVKTNKNKKVTIYAVKTVAGTPQWSAANKNVASYNNAIDNAFKNGKANKSKVSIVDKDYKSIVFGYAPYCIDGRIYGYTYTSAANATKYTKSGDYGTKTTTINSKTSGYDDGLHYTIPTLEAMGNWILNNSK